MDTQSPHTPNTNTTIPILCNECKKDISKDIKQYNINDKPICNLCYNKFIECDIIGFNKSKTSNIKPIVTFNFNNNNIPIKPLIKKLKPYNGFDNIPQNNKTTDKFTNRVIKWDEDKDKDIQKPHSTDIQEPSSSWSANKIITPIVKNTDARTKKPRTKSKSKQKDNRPYDVDECSSDCSDCDNSELPNKLTPPNNNTILTPPNNTILQKPHVQPSTPPQPPLHESIEFINIDSTILNKICSMFTSKVLQRQIRKWFNTYTNILDNISIIDKIKFDKLCEMCIGNASPQDIKQFCITNDTTMINISSKCMKLSKIFVDKLTHYLIESYKLENKIKTEYAEHYEFFKIHFDKTYKITFDCLKKQSNKYIIPFNKYSNSLQKNPYDDDNADNDDNDDNDNDDNANNDDNDNDNDDNDDDDDKNLNNSIKKYKASIDNNDDNDNNDNNDKHTPTSTQPILSKITLLPKLPGFMLVSSIFKDKNTANVANASNASNASKTVKPVKKVVEVKQDTTSFEYEWLGDIKTIDDLIKIGTSYNILKRKRHNLNIQLLHALVEPLTELKNMIGMHDVKSIVFEQIIYYLQDLDTKNVDMLHSVIVGPPGVGKTQLTYILAKIYNRLGFLNTDKVISVKRDDLIGEYVGHTAKKTRKVLDSALGGVLLIDEIYALGTTSDKDFAHEAIDMINVYLSEHAHDLVCVIAGYKQPTYEKFFNQNQGLARRFTHHFEINGYTPSELTLILKQVIEKQTWYLDISISELELIIKQNIELFPHFGGDMTTLFACCKKTHAKRLLNIQSEHELNATKKHIILKDIQDGILIYKKIKANNATAGNTDNNLKYINTMYS